MLSPAIAVDGACKRTREARRPLTAPLLSLDVTILAKLRSHATSSSSSSSSSSSAFSFSSSGTSQFPLTGRRQFSYKTNDTPPPPPPSPPPPPRLGFSLDLFNLIGVLFITEFSFSYNVLGHRKIRVDMSSFCSVHLESGWMGSSVVSGWFRLINCCKTRRHGNEESPQRREGKIR